MNAIENDVRAMVDKELAAANERFPQFRSPHEGAAVICEELEEAQEEINAATGMYQALWIKVKHDEDTYKIAELLRMRAEAAACECIQLAAMAQKIIDSGGERMTIRELSQLYYLNREIEQEKERIKQLQEAATNTAAKISGMPFVGGISDKTAIAAAIADSKAIIDAKLDLCVAEYNRLCRYIARIDDSLMRQIISLRFINGLTWHQVAQRIGGGNTEESVKKACYRFIKSCPECPDGM